MKLATVRNIGEAHDSQWHRAEAERLLASASRKLNRWELGDWPSAMLREEGMAELAAAQVHATLALGGD